MIVFYFESRIKKTDTEILFQSFIQIEIKYAKVIQAYRNLSPPIKTKLKRASQSKAQQNCLYSPGYTSAFHVIG